MSENIRIVLVSTFHPGNIGSVARVMKNMGLSNLVLVNPVEFPSGAAEQMAAGAKDMLDRATVVGSVDEAIRGCGLVMACTARIREFDLPELLPEKAAELAVSPGVTGDTAILFGPERFGLSNEDVSLARYRITIPTSPEYPSLNLASAVQILSYELLKARQATVESIGDPIVVEIPSSDEMRLFYEHLESVLYDTGFIVKQHPGNIMKKFHRLFDRAEMSREELNIMRGVLASVQRHKSETSD